MPEVMPTMPVRSITALTIISALLAVPSFFDVLTPTDYSSKTWDMVDSSGYPYETHTITTKDGYVLTLNRFSNGKTENETPKVPVLLLHGLFGTGADFLTLGPGKALAFLLADKNYDVWIGHFRGTPLSMKHKRYNPKTSEEYWSFSLHETSINDLPAMIDYILQHTKTEKLHLVPFSLGAAKVFILLSEKPEYSDKIRLVSALSPAALLLPSRSPILRLFSYFPDFLHDQLLNMALPYIIPGQASKNTLIQTHQMKLSERFTRQDLGEEDNLRMYRQETPPEYNLEAIKVPVAIYYARNDAVVEAKGVEKLLKILPNVVNAFVVPSKTYQHMDFVFGEETPELLYPAIIEEMAKH